MGNRKAFNPQRLRGKDAGHEKTRSAHTMAEVLASLVAGNTLENLFDPKNMNNRKGIKHYLQQSRIIS